VRIFPALSTLAWLGVCACGLSAVGSGPSDGGEPGAEGGPAGPGAEGGGPTDGGPGPLGDSDVFLDGGPGADAADAKPPDPTKVTISYAAGKDAKVYKFDSLTNAFTALTSTGCPSAEESAVLSDGSVYVTSSDNTKLFTWTSTGCTLVRGASSFPYALGTAPVGTLSATEEVLVGYMGAGDYVRVDRANGDVTLVTAGALGTLRPSGDVTAFGAKGFLAAASGTGSGSFACAGGGDCIVEVSLKTGVPITFVKRFAGYGIYGLAHSRGSLLFYANGQVFPYDLTTQTLGAALATMPGTAAFSGAGAPPYPPP
jgi:hypothetical protein